MVTNTEMQTRFAAWGTKVYRPGDHINSLSSESFPTGGGEGVTVGDERAQNRLNGRLVGGIIAVGDTMEYTYVGEEQMVNNTPPSFISNLPNNINDSLFFRAYTAGVTPSNLEIPSSLSQSILGATTMREPLSYAPKLGRTLSPATLPTNFIHPYNGQFVTPMAPITPLAPFDFVGKNVPRPLHNMSAPGLSIPVVVQERGTIPPGCKTCPPACIIDNCDTWCEGSEMHCKNCKDEYGMSDCCVCCCCCSCEGKCPVQCYGCCDSPCGCGGTDWINELLEVWCCPRDGGGGLGPGGNGGGGNGGGGGGFGGRSFCPECNGGNGGWLGQFFPGKEGRNYGIGSDFRTFLKSRSRSSWFPGCDQAQIQQINSARMKALECIINSKLRALFPDWALCVIGSLIVSRYQCEDGEFRCCPFPEQTRCCDKQGNIIGISCRPGNITILCESFFWRNLGYSSTFCQQVHTLIHEAIHRCGSGIILGGILDRFGGIDVFVKQLIMRCCMPECFHWS